MKEYNKELKSIMVWSLTALVGIAGILICLNAYNLRKQAERDNERWQRDSKKILAIPRRVIEKKDAKIKALSQENFNLRVKLLKKAKLSSHYENVPAILRGGQGYIATAYTYTGNNTASGVCPQANHTIAVDRHLVPLGAKVRLRCPSMPDYDGIYTAEDTGGNITGRRVDVFVDSRGEAINFGRRTVLVEVLK